MLWLLLTSEDNCLTVDKNSPKRLAIVGLKSAACKYWASSGFWVCVRMLLTEFSDCCIPMGTSHITVVLFLVTLIISSPWFWIYIACLSSVTVNPSSHKTTNDIDGAVWIFGKIWICLAGLIRPGIWSVAICVDYIVLPSGNLDFISLSITTGAIVGVACLARCILSPEYAIDIMLVLVGLGEVSIWFIKIVLGLPILLLLTIYPNRHSQPFLLPPSRFM